MYFAYVSFNCLEENIFIDVTRVIYLIEFGSSKSVRKLSRLSFINPLREFYFPNNPLESSFNFKIKDLTRFSSIESFLNTFLKNPQNQIEFVPKLN